MSDEDNNKSTLSVQVRLRRTVTKAAHISVEITRALVTDDNRIDGKKVFERALEMATSPQITWQVEQDNIEVHPIQKANETE